MISVALCAATAVGLHAQDQQKPSGDESWAITKDNKATNGNPSRTTESHLKIGNRTVDKQRVDVLGLNGSYQPSGEAETETIQIDTSTTRTIVRGYRWDENGQRILVQVTEQNSRTTAGGDTHIESKTSAADVNGNFRVVRREIEDTKQISPGVEETKNTVYQADSYGGFSQTRQTQELKTRGADDNVAVKKTTLIPDGNGGWKVNEQTEKTIKDDGTHRSTEERVSRSDLDGKLYDTGRTVTQEVETPAGEKKKTVETYSIYGVGYTSGGMVLNQRLTTTTKKNGSGGETTEQQFEQPAIGNPGDGPKVLGKTKYVVKYAANGTQQTKTVETRDASGKFNVDSSETQKSTQPPPPQKPPAPPDKP